MAQTIREVIKSGFKQFRELDTRVQRNQINAIQYIENMATTTGSQLRVDKWDLFKIFGSKQHSHLIITNRNLINRRFFETLNAQKESTPVSKTQKISGADEKKIEKFAAELAKGAAGSVTELRKQRADALVRAKYHANNFRACVKEAQAAAMSMKGAPAIVKGVLEDIQAIVADGYWKLHEVTASQISFVTRSDVIVDWKKGGKAKVHLRVNFGKFKAILHISGEGMGQISCEGYQKNIEIEGNIHPHVDGDGGICWGTAADTVAEKLADNKVRDVLQLLGSILNSYNDGNPYVDLASFQAKSPKSAPAGTKIEKLCKGCEYIESDCQCDGEDEDF